MIDVMQIVASIEAEKESKNVFPTHALLPEIIIKVNWCETLNTYGFSTKQNK